jgi:hypothetical protein
MNLKKYFCPSPWFHMRITNDGSYEFCRWASSYSIDKNDNIRSIEPIEWFQKNLSEVRQGLLSGQALSGCSDCQKMEEHNKVSGRQRQLLKVGVKLDTFTSSMKSSKWLPIFSSSQQDGTTEQYPQDWQIDLGNYCNSACLFCDPYSSSRLAAEQKKLGLIQQLPPRAWCDDPVLLDKFLHALKSSPKLSYLHFIGGETLITPAFKKILSALISMGLHQQVSIGFTVNLTVWDQSTVDMLSQFKEVNLGMSVECLHPVNDYVRYGGKLQQTLELLEKWIMVGKQHDWLISLRTTPTVLSVLHLHTVYQFALDNQISVESCNFLNNPKFMRSTVLPQIYRQAAIDKLQPFTKLTNTDTQLINTRDPNHYQSQLCQDAVSYVNYLSTSADESYRLPDLISYLKKTESIRNNSVLDYLPEYEELFRTAGY